MNKRGFRLGIVSALSLSLLVSNPAHAQGFLPGAPSIGLENLPGAGTIGGITNGNIPGVGNVGDILNDPMGFIFGKLQTWIQNADTAWGELSTDNPLASLSTGEGGWLDIVGIANETKGALGMPDPERSAKAAAERIDGKDSNDPAEVTLAHQRTVARNALERELARAGAQATLGKEGQQHMKQSVEQSAQVVQASNQAGQKAQSLDVTQDVMKQMALQNSQMTNLLGAMYTEELGAKVDRAHANLNLSNISQSLDQQQRARRAQISGEAALIMQIANQSSLR